jgi:phospholipase C
VTDQDSRFTFDPSRRRFLTGIAAAGAAGAIAGCGSGGNGASALTAQQLAALLPNPKDSGIDHIIVLMMENRSFDHYLGWLPGADGVQAGLRYPDKNGEMQSTFGLAPEYQGCQFEDPNHSYEGGHKQYNDGKLDGFLQTVTKAGVKFPIGYYTQNDLPFFAGAAPAYTTCDRYFPGILSSTFPNRFYMHSGQTDRNSNTLTMSSLPTIWDRCADKGVSTSYYFADVPITGLWGPKYVSISKPYNDAAGLVGFLADCKNGTLPNVSFLDPNFGLSAGEPFGISQDDHPFADIRDGQAFLNQVYTAVRTSPNWEKTLLIINYDEWGGFFDHVAPPTGPVSDAEKAIGNLDGRLGFRVPCLLIGPRAKRGHITHFDFEPNSILDLIRWRFGLDPLSVRSGKVNNLAIALDFQNPPNLSAPIFNVAPGPFGQVCVNQVTDPGQLPVPVPAPATGGNAPASIAEMDPEILQSRLDHYADWQGVRDLGIKYGIVR